MFSTAVGSTRQSPVETHQIVHTTCGVESSMNKGGFETYTQSTGPTTTTTLLYS
jgi:hypothetical protein